MGTLNHFTFYVLRLCFVYDEHLGNAQLAIGDLCALLPADHLLLDDPRVAKMARLQEPDQGVVVLIFSFFARFSGIHHRAKYAGS